MVYQQLIKLSRLLFVTVSVATMTTSVRADGGFVLWQRPAGSFTVTAFATESPLHTGTADISFLVEDTEESRAIVNARVFITLENEKGATVRSEATHTQARNKLLYCSLLSLPRAGHWKMNLVVARGNERADFFHDLTVTDSQSRIFDYWKLLAFPPVVMILFIINQFLRREL
jgi:hypothetical protein